MKRTVVAVAALACTGLLAACGGPDVSAADPSTVLKPGTYPLGISLQVDEPVCVQVGDQYLCSLDVWYANGTGDQVEIDAGATIVKDDAGASYTGTAGADVSDLVIDAGTRSLVLWSVRMPWPHKPTEVIWTGPDGRTAKAILRTPPSATSSPTSSSASPTPTTESPTPTPTSSSPTPTPTTESPTPTPTPTPSPKPTKTSKPSPTPTTPPPTGSIG